MQLTLQKITPELAGIELGIMNSDTYFNRLSKGKEILTAEELDAEKNQNASIGSERFVLIDNDEAVGIIEYLLLNPGDGCVWLGLLLIRKEMQSLGYGLGALEWFESMLRERGTGSYRIGVIAGNLPAEKFWRKRGFAEVRRVQQERYMVIVMERKIS